MESRRLKGSSVTSRLRGDEERAVGGDDTVRREQTQGLYVGRRINKIIHAFIEAGMGGLS
jgi:hypothetical protein